MDSELKPDPNLETLRSIAALASAAVERSQSPQNMRLVGAGVAVALKVGLRDARIQICASSEEDLDYTLGLLSPLSDSLLVSPKDAPSSSDFQRVLIYAADNP